MKQQIFPEGPYPKNPADLSQNNKMGLKALLGRVVVPQDLQLGSIFNKTLILLLVIVSCILMTCIEWFSIECRK